ncbi:phospholipase D family protein [Candidatus Nitrotoga sp. M5]|uniref:phospholipase D family protein n=1 Tax=Candidatus Nitrotoga sp. M5 TaxID=2890409 RepID=UPI001EF3CE4F|nr:phospholipase D family protein [Candidatus Nitrotoga sp. M5]CAH1385245.1 PLD phosphodiesterase domain-containing protein [Candidatus Nitrotoga sp. M5]
MTRIIAESYNSERLHVNELYELLTGAEETVDIATAYLTDTKLLGALKNTKVRLLTSVSCADLISGATSLEALRWLCNEGVDIRVLPSSPKFHAKVYIADKSKAIITSANLTNNGIHNNIEVGALLESRESNELSKWFDSAWSSASPLSNDLLASLSKYTDKIEQELTTVNSKIREFDKHISLSIAQSVDSHLIRLDDGGRQFFICNSDRRNGTRTADGGYLHEELMQSLGTAMAWESFKHPKHMSKARKGDIVFLFAKGKGVIAVGEVTEEVEVADGIHKKRLSQVANTTEWRICVNWVTQRNKFFACYIENPPLCTFMDISAEKYKSLRVSVLNYFSELGSA